MSAEDDGESAASGETSASGTAPGADAKTVSDATPDAAALAGDTVLEVKNLRHVFSPGSPFESVALSDVSFALSKNSFTALIGHTGSGKSTLIQHLNGLLKPTAGSVWIEGADIAGGEVKLRDIRRKVGLVFQYPEYQLFEETVLKDVCYGPLNLGMSQEEAEEKARRAIELVGLDFEEIKDRSPFALSGGQKRRVAIAGVIAMEPQVLILDEPTAGLDPKSHKDILSMVETIKNEGNVTILLVSHNMGDVARLADRVLVMDGGRLWMNGTPRQVFSRESELLEIGLGLPPAAEFLRQLAKNGAPVATQALTISEAVTAITQWKRGESQC